MLSSPAGASQYKVNKHQLLLVPGTLIISFHMHVGCITPQGHIGSYFWSSDSIPGLSDFFLTPVYHIFIHSFIVPFYVMILDKGKQIYKNTFQRTSPVQNSAVRQTSLNRTELRVGKKLKGPICDQNRFYKSHTVKYIHIAYRIIPQVLSQGLFNCAKIYIMRYTKFTALTI